MMTDSVNELAEAKQEKANLEKLIKAVLTGFGDSYFVYGSKSSSVKALPAIVALGELSKMFTEEICAERK